MLRPATTADVAAAVRLCAAHGVAIVPQGGNTSMVGGAAVSEDGSQIVLSLSRLNKLRALDPIDMTMEIEAGVTLKAAQEIAAEADCLLPLSISSEGSAQIGGVLATNAGGNNTARYGNARDLVLRLPGLFGLPRRSGLLYNAAKPRGINMRSAPAPWGPWSKEAVVFDPWKDGGYGEFMHVSSTAKGKQDAFPDWHASMTDQDAVIPVAYCPLQRAGLVSNYQTFIERTRYLRRGDYIFIRARKGT